ncbi:MULTISPECIES: 2Fe-2S iron-sulfur cluster-binding protein [Streptomyces]|uniref:2Fe-2S iron-sulfur cluster-binding protein n=2 Tax=Streptomyces TaxID=1883 RepID=A0ABV9IPB2_9ACTN
MTDDQHGEGAPQNGGRWDPLPQGDYDDGATAFVKLPEGGIDALLARDTPLAAPGHGYVPPQIAVAPGTDGTDTWAAPAGGTEWPAAQTGPQTVGDDRFSYQPGSTGEWNFQDRTAAPAAPGHDVTGEWSIPVAGGDLPDESGEFTASALVEQWGGTPPATLPGGAPAPWATGGTNGAGQPWAQQAEAAGGTGVAHPGAQDTAGHTGVQDTAGTGYPGAHGPTGAQPAQDAPAFGRAPEHGAAHDTAYGAAHDTARDTAYGAAHDTARDTAHEAARAFGHTPAHGTDFTPAHGPDGTPPHGTDFASAHRTDHTPAYGTELTPPGGAAVTDSRTAGAVEAAEAPERDSEANRATGDARGPHETAEAAHGPARTRTAQPTEPAAPAPGDTPDHARVEGETDGATDEAAAEESDTPDESPPPPAEEHPLASYVLRVNGSDRPVTDAWIGESLLYVLRERLGLAGAKDGCSQGECGACNVQVDGRLVASCLVPAVTTASSEVRTVEGLAVDGQPSDVQRALARCGAVQCGFCVPGMAMTVHDLLEGNPAPTELEARQALCGNLCRCSGYKGVLRAVKDVVAEREAHAAADAETDGDEPRIPHQAGPGAGGVNASAFENPAQPHPHDPVYGQGQDGGQT